MQCSNLPAILPIFGMLIWVAVVIYFVVIAGRLVRAVERIANKLESTP